MKKIETYSLIATLICLACIGGCRRESREYLQALEAKDRLIESSHMARKDMIDSLGRKHLSLADRAMDQEGRLEEQSHYVQGRLDSYRPHAPNPKLFAHARELVRNLEQDRNNLRARWVEALRDTNSDIAKNLSAKIRDVEIALAEANEAAERSRPFGTSAHSSSDAVLAQDLALKEPR